MAVSLGSAVLTIGGDASGLGAVLDRAEASTRATLTRVGDASRALGYTFTAIGGGITAALGASVREAISFESAFAGVRKTMDASEEEFAVINRALREMSMEMPVSAQELARIAEIGGQLGVPKEAIVEFTRVIAMLSMTTDMTSDAAAELVSRIVTLMNVDFSNIERVGAAIADLGNNGNSTEREIAYMASRLAGASYTAGLSVPNLLGFSEALASIGLEAELGSNIFGLMMKEIHKAVLTESENLQVFASVAGLSAKEFAAAWKTDPAQAILLFMEGMTRMQRNGENLYAVFELLKFEGRQTGNVLLTMAAKSDLFAQSLDRAAKAYGEPNGANALTEEFGKRAATTESQLATLKQMLEELAREIGEILVPVLLSTVERAKEIVRWVIEWVRANPELTAQIVQIAAVAGGLMAALGPVLILLPGLAIGFGALAAGLTALVSPAALVAAAIVGGLIAAFYALRPVMEDARAWVTANWDRIVAAFQSAKQIVITVMQILYQGLRLAWTLISALIVGETRGVLNALDVLGPDSKNATDDFLSTVQHVLDALNQILPQILAVVRAFADFMQRHWNTLATATEIMVDATVGKLIRLAEAFMYVWSIVAQAASGIASAVAQVAAWFGFTPGAAETPAAPAPPQFASGGTMRRSGLAYVHQDELLHLPGGTRVYNRRETQEMLAGGAMNFSFGDIVVHGVSDPDTLAKVISRKLEAEVQNTFAKRGLRLSRA